MPVFQFVLLQLHWLNVLELRIDSYLAKAETHKNVVRTSHRAEVLSELVNQLCGIAKE